MTHEVIALRTAAQQAPEALEDARTFTGAWPTGSKAITNLRAALAQQAEPVQEPVDAHTTTLRNLLECCLTWKLDARVLGNVTARQAVTALRAALAQQDEPVQLRELLIQAASMAVAAERAGKYGGASWVADAVLEDCPKKQAEPIEPVAWIQPDHLQKARIAPFLCRVEPTQRCADFVPLYLAPPQRKPLAEWQINDLMADIDPEDVCSWSFRQGVYAAEKHHGVKL